MYRPGFVNYETGAFRFWEHLICGCKQQREKQSKPQRRLTNFESLIFRPGKNAFVFFERQKVFVSGRQWILRCRLRNINKISDNVFCFETVIFNPSVVGQVLIYIINLCNNNIPGFFIFGYWFVIELRLVSQWFWFGFSSVALAT